MAVQGCSHGSLSAIYDTVAQYSSSKSTKVDLLLLCGDFQALRSQYDFPSLAVPPKYHALGTFHQYYSGERVAPVLTIVIGGNHEASNYMWELYHGGWLAENIYYMGAAGSVMVDGFRIAGASGIYKDHDHRKGGSSLSFCLTLTETCRSFREGAIQQFNLAERISHTIIRRSQAHAGECPHSLVVLSMRNADRR